MTTKTDYSHDEWQLLLDVPTLAGLSVLMAAQSSLGSFKEAMALARSIMDGAKSNPGVELIESIVAARTSGHEKSSAESFQNNPYAGLDSKKLLNITSEKCREAAQLMVEKSTPQEANAYKDWVLSIADRVSKAAHEGGFLGFGGVRVSPEETSAINTLKGSLAA